ncbi:helix-turn-helix domain-containing protein [Bacillus sp. UNC41MFS5]|uniref:helix-turn-helix domain-containing protein n=1 Tax=Bacillus sp. UNC41MFS5 TaxID=1449046 RepID=UPI001E5FD018|nr:helix-turn-helix domain-containing protein [Bacillus sp. UNC41MFS5]
MNKLGELSGVSAMYISHLESGKRDRPSPEIIGRLAKGLEESYKNLMTAAGYIDPIDFNILVNEREDKIWSLSQQKQEQIYLDYLLGSNHPIFFQDKLLTKEGKAKIKSLIQIFLRD